MKTSSEADRLEVQPCCITPLRWFVGVNSEDMQTGHVSGFEWSKRY